jgi:hypothetical protein
MGSLYRVEKQAKSKNDNTPSSTLKMGGNTFLRKAGKLLPDYTASHLRRQYYS